MTKISIRIAACRTSCQGSAKCQIGTIESMRILVKIDAVHIQASIFLGVIAIARIDVGGLKVSA